MPGEDKRLPVDLKWCEHIHNWGDAFYFTDTLDPFAVSGPYVWGQRTWTVCPICRTESPLKGAEKKPFICPVGAMQCGHSRVVVECQTPSAKCIHRF